jgi:hypothetical protein
LGASPSWNDQVRRGAETVHLSEGFGEVLLEYAGAHRGRTRFSAVRGQKLCLYWIGAQSAMAFNAAGGMEVAIGLDSISPKAAKKPHAHGRPSKSSDLHSLEVAESEPPVERTLNSASMY